MSKDNQVRELVQLLVKNHTMPIYAIKIADLLQLPVEVIENELHQMVEEDILQHTFELHCCQCGHVIASFEDPRLLTSGQVECPGCLTQTESIAMNDMVSVFISANRYLTTCYDS